MLNNRVLLVEDDELSRFMMEEMLTELGVDYEVAHDGQECIDILEARPRDFNSVLLDIHMPRKTGLDAITEIRENPNNPPNDIYVIAVTADSRWHNKTIAKTKGFNSVLAKPVGFSQLERELV